MTFNVGFAASTTSTSGQSNRTGGSSHLHQLQHHHQQQLHHQQQHQLHQHQQHQHPPDTHGTVHSLDEAYRRLGHKLSQRVMTSAEDYHHPHRVSVTKIGSHSSSAFDAPHPQQYQSSNHDVLSQLRLLPSSFQSSAASSYNVSKASKSSTLQQQLQQQQLNTYEISNRNNKVAKIGYSDRSSQGSCSILKKLTCSARVTFRKIQDTKQKLLLLQLQQQQQQPPSSAATISPQSGGLLATLKLDDTAATNIAPASTTTKRGFLETALEAQATKTNYESTTVSTTTCSSDATNTQQQPTSSRKCLTLPREPTENNGLDNSEGNLIVHQGDVIPVSNVSTVQKNQSSPAANNYISNDKNMTNAGLGKSLRVVDLLGQGTFAQVFLCETCWDDEEGIPQSIAREAASTPAPNEETQPARQIALKVVKNKQAYTRQAAIEIDVFRTLADSKINMVQLQCYFVYENHLCLVFELLGLNLYEVLKGRQFRGLPLGIVKSLMKQAIEGVRELSTKSIVHCDLKPENILLDGDAVSVIDAGDVVVSSSTTTMSSKALLSSTTSTSTTTSTTNKNDKSNDTATKMTATTITAAPPPSGTGTSNMMKKYVGTPNTEDSTGTTVSNPGSSLSGMSDSTSSSSSQENTETTTTSPTTPPLVCPIIKLIDFGSACYEGRTSHTYIQSRFYRSPEVLIGVPYDSAIDMWSLGCVAAELFLGLPILPGVHEHDQLGRICEMISPLPDWMFDQGSKASKYFVKQFSRTPQESGKIPGFDSNELNDDNSNHRHHGIASTAVLPPPQPSSSLPPAKPSWRIKTQEEYIQSLSSSEIHKKGGLAKLERQPANRYFKRTKLAEIIMFHGKLSPGEGKEQLALFVHFLLGIMEPDPWKRWTAFQAAQHPFLTGVRPRIKRRDADSDVKNTDGNQAKDSNNGNIHYFDVHWIPPWDPSICRRKLLNVQKTREKQQAIRRGNGSGRQQQQQYQRYDGGDRVEMESHDRQRRGSDTALSMDGSIANSDVMGRQSYMSGDRVSPPSPTGRPHSGLHSALGSSGLHSALLGSDFGRSSHGYPGQPQGIPSYSQYSNSGSVSSMAMSYGDMSIPQNALHAPNGPQSYSEYSHESANVPRMEAEFGFALQRPGVVPSAHEHGGSYSSVSQHSVSNAAYSPHHNHNVPNLTQLQMAYGVRHTSLPTMSHRRGSRTTGSYMGNVPLGQTSYNHSLHHAPTMIREDCSDHQSVGGETSSIGSGASLLAQQLEAQAAKARDSRNSLDHNSNASGMDAVQYRHQQQQQQLHHHSHCGYMMAQQPPMYSEYSNGVPVSSSGAGYYSTYGSDHHMPNHNQMYAHGSNHGGSGFHPGSDQQVPIHVMQQQQYGGGGGGYSRHAPPDYGRYNPQHYPQHQHHAQQHQPSLDDRDRVAGSSRQGGGSNYPYFNRGLSM